MTSSGMVWHTQRGSINNYGMGDACINQSIGDMFLLPKAIGAASAFNRSQAIGSKIVQGSGENGDFFRHGAFQIRSMQPNLAYS
jgi:hypothetical protein